MSKKMTNLDKFYVIEEMMIEFQRLIDEYLEKLQHRHESMALYRNEYKKLYRAVHDIRRRLSSEDVEEEKVVLLKIARNELFDHMQRLQEEMDSDAYVDHRKNIRVLEECRESLNGNVSQDIINDVHTSLTPLKINVSSLDLLIDHQNDDIEQKKEIVNLINKAEDEYLDGFKNYRKACERNDGVYESFDDIFSVLAQLNYTVEASIMADALPDTDGEFKERPNPNELLEVLLPFKSSGLEYWQSNYKNSQGYDLNVQLAQALAYMRRALLEDREYVGSKNASDKLIAAYEELSSYMYERYHELGGTPKNYHGHEDRKR